MDREEVSERDGMSDVRSVQAASKPVSKPVGSLNEQQAIRYANDAEVNRAMTDVFQKHDRLFRELAK